MLVVLLVAPLLGIDNFAVAMGLAASASGRWPALRVATAFGAGAAVASATGLFVGQSAMTVVGGWGHIGGGALLCGLGVYEVIEWLTGGHGLGKHADRLSVLIAISIGVSIDTVAAGLALGIYGTPAVPSVMVITAATVVMTLIGFAVSSRIRETFARWGDFVTGGAIFLVGVGILLRIL